MQYGRSDSYRVAVNPRVPDDGRTPDGRPRARRKAGKKEQDLDDLKQEVSMVSMLHMCLRNATKEEEKSNVVNYEEDRISLADWTDTCLQTTGRQ